MAQRYFDSLIRRTLVLAPILCLGASLSLAHPPARLDLEQFVENFDSGFDHPDYVSLQLNINLDAGSLLLGTEAQFSLVDPNANGFVGSNSSPVAFSDVAISIQDDPQAGGDWQLSFEGVSTPIPTQLTLTAAGSKLTISYHNEYVDAGAEVDRSVGWLVFRAGDYFSVPTIERDGVTTELTALLNVEFRVDRVTIHGSQLRVDDVVITPWYFAAATETQSWGGVKALY